MFTEKQHLSIGTNCIQNFELTRCDGITVISMPTTRKININGDTKTTYSFMQTKNRFEILPDSSKDKLRFYINKAYRRAIVSGKGFEISEIISKLYS